MNLSEQYNEYIPFEIRSALAICANVAEDCGVKIYLVGGIVRDLILNIKNYDVDIAVVGDSIKFAEECVKACPDLCKIKSLHHDFMSAKLKILINNSTVELDLASTRTEFYEKPAMLPTLKDFGVELKEDMIRRDFTINSMALSLNKENFGELIDYLGGFDDLKSKIVRILHPESFIDDPTRIIRALKFRVRFGADYDPQSFELQKQCLESSQFDGLCGERIKSELMQTFNMNMPEAYEKFFDEKIYRLISPNINLGKKSSGERVRNSISKLFSNGDSLESWLVYLSNLLRDLDGTEVQEILTKLNLSAIDSKVILGFREMISNLNLLINSESRFDVYEFFEGYNILSITAFYSCVSIEIQQKVELYIFDLCHIKLTIGGSDLLELGLKPGPDFARLLSEVLKARVNGEITSSQEQDFLKNLID